MHMYARLPRNLLWMLFGLLLWRLLLIGLHPSFQVDAAGKMARLIIAALLVIGMLPKLPLRKLFRFLIKPAEHVSVSAILLLVLGIPALLAGYSIYLLIMLYPNLNPMLASELDAGGMEGIVVFHAVMAVICLGVGLINLWVLLRNRGLSEA